MVIGGFLFTVLVGVVMWVVGSFFGVKEVYALIFKKE